MNRSKKIYSLLAVLVVLVVATISMMNYEEKQELIKNSDEIILEIDSEQITSLSWNNETTSLAFTNDGGWTYDDDQTFPVDSEAITELLDVFSSFGVSFIIENVDNYSQYGLDTPVCTINFSTSDKDYEVSLGAYSTMDAKRYVSIGDGNVYLVQTDPLDYYDAEISDIIDHDDLPTYDTVSKISFSGSENYDIIYEENSSNSYLAEDVYFTDNSPLDTSNVESYLKTITSLGLTDYVSYNATDLAEYGLDNPLFTVTIDYTLDDVSSTFTLNISSNEDEIDPETEVVTAYAKVDSSQIVYQLSTSDYESLKAMSYNDLRHKEIISASFEDITQFDVTLDGETYNITSKDVDGVRVYYYNDLEVDTTTISSAFSSLLAEEFTDQTPTLKEEISLTLHLDNENFSEVTVELYRYDGTYCLAVVDGTPMCLTLRSSSVDVMESFYEIVLN